MDTKLKKFEGHEGYEEHEKPEKPEQQKKSKPVKAWLCFFFAVNILVSSAILGLILFNHEYFNIGSDVKSIFTAELKNSNQFKSAISTLFINTLQDIREDKSTVQKEKTIITDNNGITITQEAIPENSESTLKSDNSEAGDQQAGSSDSTPLIFDSSKFLDREGENLLYYATNTKTGKTISNLSNETSLNNEALISGLLTGHLNVSLPEGYDYYLSFDGSRFNVNYNETPLDIYRNDSGYSRYGLGMYLSKNNLSGIESIKDYRILFIVRKEIVENPYDYSILYRAKQRLDMAKWLFAGFIAMVLLGLVLLLIYIIKRKQKREFDRKLAGFTGRLWLEVKVLLTVLVISSILIISRFIGRYDFFYAVIVPLCFIAASCWWFYLMLIDLVVNRKKVFTHNSLNSIIKSYMAYERKKPFQKGLMIRVYTLIASETVLVFTAVLFAIISLGGGVIIFGEILCLMTIAFGVYILYRYVRRYGTLVNDIGLIMDQVQEIRSGIMKEKHIIKPDADLFVVQEDLNRIQEGLSRAIEEKIRSERMKAELVTNVSHDLKTPLTSIISYVDLLSHEEELPQHVKDYILILAQKTEKLKTLIQDLFDLTKANSGNIAIEKEKLDLGKVITQTMADMSDAIEQSGLAFKVKIPQEPIYIISDGSKLYRVFQNLLTNTLKYSLAGSRVYVDAVVRVNDSNGSKGGKTEESEMAAGPTKPAIERRTAVVTIRNTANYEMNFDEAEITERFVRADEARTTEGSGLGLAIAESFTHACGGTLKVKVDGDLFKVILTFDVITE